MPRYTVLRSQSAASASQSTSASPADGTDISPTPEPVITPVPEDFRHDSRVHILGELSKVLLVECDPAVAEEWQARIPGWAFQLERKVKIPDTKQKLKRRAL